MRRFMITGGFIGFLLVFLVEMLNGRSMLIVLRDSMIACLIMSYLFRLLYKQMEGSMATALEKELKLMQEEARAETEKENQASGVE